MAQIYLPGWGGVGGWLYSDYKGSLSSNWTYLELQLELSLATNKQRQTNGGKQIKATKHRQTKKQEQINKCIQVTIDKQTQIKKYK